MTNRELIKFFVNQIEGCCCFTENDGLPVSQYYIKVEKDKVTLNWTDEDFQQRKITFSADGIASARLGRNDSIDIFDIHGGAHSLRLFETVAIKPSFPNTKP